jgi:hypothetical protein
MSIQALLLQESADSETVQKARILLISNSTLETDRAKRTNNRKTKKVCESHVHDGVEYKVNGKGSGIFKEMLSAIIQQLLIAQEIHKRVLVVRFDLHSQRFGKDSAEISAFIEQIKLWVKRHYQTHDIGHVWARELEKANFPHYHLALFIDGDKIRYPKKLLSFIRETWEDKNPYHSAIPIKNPYYFIDNDNVLHEAVYRLSYLAKVRGKGYRPDQAKDYSTSRLKIKSRSANKRAETN